MNTALVLFLSIPLITIEPTVPFKMHDKKHHPQFLLNGENFQTVIQSNTDLLTYLHKCSIDSMED